MTLHEVGSLLGLVGAPFWLLGLGAMLVHQVRSNRRPGQAAYRWPQQEPPVQTRPAVPFQVCLWIGLALSGAGLVLRVLD